MEKLRKGFNIIITIAVLAIFATSLSYGSNLYSARINEIMRKIVYYIILFVCIVAIVYFAIYIFTLIKKEFHNIRVCGDPLFEKIDQYKMCWTRDKYYYIKIIQIINLYYGENGEVNNLVKNKEIDRLYARAKFLYMQNSLTDNLSTYYFSLIISILASFFCKMYDSESSLVQVVCLVLTCLAFTVICLSSYAFKRENNSNINYVRKYEKKLLSEKIKKLEAEFVINLEDEKFLETKQLVIDELIRIRKKTIRKKKIEKVENDINQVTQLDLCIGEENGCHLREILINGKKGYLVYDREKGKENKHFGEANLINEEYFTLYQILKRYDLISY